MRIGLDVDGCLADFNKAYIQLVKEVSGKDLFGPNYVPTTWAYPEEVGYSAETVQAAWDTIMTNKSFWFTLEPLDGMFEFLEWIGRDDHDIVHDLYFVTSRPGAMAKLQTEAWFAQWDIPSTVLISSDKGLCCAALKLDVMIDDKLENISDIVLTSGCKTRPYLLDQPWNQSDSMAHKRVGSVEEFLNECS